MASCREKLTVIFHSKEKHNICIININRVIDKVTDRRNTMYRTSRINWTITAKEKDVSTYVRIKLAVQLRYRPKLKTRLLGKHILGFVHNVTFSLRCSRPCYVKTLRHADSNSLHSYCRFLRSEILARLVTSTALITFNPYPTNVEKRVSS